MSTEAEVVVRLDRFELDVALALPAGSTTAVLGPNGAGKTTLLRCLAGLLPIDRGRITIDGTTVDDTDTEVFVPAERRPVGVVFQDHLLFAHLDALDNVAFGLRARGVRRRQAREQASTWLTWVGLRGQARQHPGTLSGGQAQRVALARALATRPQLLLLDEPLAALDAGTRAATRRELRHHLTTFAGARLLITHDPVDAYALADSVVVLEAGRITQVGLLADVMAHPRSHYVAELLGTNLWRGRAEGTSVEVDGGGRLTVAEPRHGAVFAMVRPSAVALGTHRPEGSARNVWPGTITALEPHGERVRVHVAATPSVVAEITQSALTQLHLHPGDPVWASVKAVEIEVYEQ